MIRHIVMWKLKEEADGATRAENAMRVKSWLEACSELVPGILRFDVAVAQEGLEASCDVLLDSEFASLAALEAYNAHPQHQLLKARVAPLRAARYGFDCQTSSVCSENANEQVAGRGLLPPQPLD